MMETRLTALAQRAGKSKTSLVQSRSKIAELLESFRNAIQVHRSLHVDERILHSDTSETNIITSDGRRKSRPKDRTLEIDPWSR